MARSPRPSRAERRRMYDELHQEFGPQEQEPAAPRRQRRGRKDDDILVFRGRHGDSFMERLFGSADALDEDLDDDDDDDEDEDLDDDDDDDDDEDEEPAPDPQPEREGVRFFQPLRRRG